MRRGYKTVECSCNLGNVGDDAQADLRVHERKIS